MNPANLGTWFFSTALDGSMPLAIAVAIVAGAASFFSPCVLPLIPGFLAYSTGLTGSELQAAGRTKLVLGSMLFVLGFSTVFVAYGAAFGLVGHWLWAYREPVTIFLGGLTIVLGLVFAGALPWFQGEFRVHSAPTIGLTGAPMLGLLFGLGWTPCIGPTLSAITALSMNQGSVLRGGLLSLAYCGGLGIPFIFVAITLGGAAGRLKWIRDRSRWVARLGGGTLVVMGTLLILGRWNDVIGSLRQILPRGGLPGL